MSFNLLKTLENVLAVCAPIIAQSVAGPEAALVSAVLTAIVTNTHSVTPDQAHNLVQQLSNNPQYRYKLSQIEKIISDVMQLIAREDLQEPHSV